MSTKEQAGAQPWRPASIRAAQALFLVNGTIWLMFGTITLMNTAGGGDGSMTRLVIAVLMYGNVMAMFTCGLALGKQNRFVFFLAMTVVIINILLTLTDEFGIFDAITLVFDFILLGLLWVTRKRFFLESSQNGLD